MNAPRKSSRLRRWLFGSAWATGILFLLLAAAGYWLLGTAPGARFVLERALELAGGRVSAVGGRLAGPLTLGVVEIASPELKVRVERVELDWSPLRLVDRELRVKRLDVGTVDIATAESPAPAEPARAPTSLALPLRLFVENASVGRLRVGTLGDEKGGVVLQDISLKLSADQAAWILGDAQASTPYGRAKLSGTLGARTPLLLDMNGELEGKRNGADYRATVQAKGALAKFEATLAGSEGGLAGSGVASVEPFSPHPLRRIALKVSGVDLSGFADAPRTMLSVDADLGPTDAAFLAGPVKIANAAPGPIDDKRLPVTAAAAQLVVSEDRVEAGRLALSFTGGGRAEGKVVWSGGKLDATLAVKELDLLSWHSSLKATKLTGEISAVATGDEQSFRLALADPRFEVGGEGRLAKGVLTLERARLARGAARVEARATLALDGARAFAAQGRLERFDPSEYAEVPAGDINATFDVKGSVGEPLAGEGMLEIARSRFAGLPASGRVNVAAQGERLLRVESQLFLGATKLVTSGALGLPGDTLQAKLSSPDLAPLGRAFGQALGGRADLDLQLSGAFAQLSGRLGFSAKDLVLPGEQQIASLVGRLELGAGDDGRASAQVDLRGLGPAGKKTQTLERASLAVKGTRRSHEIRLEAHFPGKNSLRAFLDGGVVAGARLPEWRGRLESLDVSTAAPIALAAPASLVASAERIELGEATLIGAPGEFRLSVTRWTPSGIVLRGSSGAIRVRNIRQALAPRGPMGSNLVLKGDWDLRIGETVDGHVAIRSEAGDVRVGDPRLALGLDTLSLRADADAGRVRAILDIRGKQAGQWKAEASATVRRGDNGWEVAPDAALDGRFDLDVPELAWMAAWLGPEASINGRVRGEGSLSGTARNPSWKGRVEATGLSIREPLLGAEVSDGTIALVLEERTMRIERFALSAPWQPVPEAARAIADAARPATGTLSAEGAMDIATRKGSVRVKATGFPLTSLATRFIAVSGEGEVQLDALTTSMKGDFTVDAGWVGIPASAPPALSDDVIVDRGKEAPAVAQEAARVRLDLRVGLGRHLHFRGRGLSTRLAGSLRLVGDVGPNLRATGTIRADGGTFDAYGRSLAIERGAINFQGPINNPGLNVLALRKGLPVEAGVEVVGTVARPRVRLYSSPDVPDPEKLAWLVLGRGQGDISAGDASMLLGAANSLLGSDMSSSSMALGLGIDDVRMGRDESSTLGSLPQSTVAGRTGASTAGEVLTVGKRLSDDIYLSYQQGLADAEGTLRVAWQFTRRLEVILRAGYLPGIDAVYRFTFN